MSTPTEIYFPEVIALEKVGLSLVSDTPKLQPYSQHISFESSSELNPSVDVDLSSFPTNVSLEWSLTQKVNESSRLGNEYVQYLYCYRSIAKAIPEPNVEWPVDMKKAMVEIFAPSMHKIKELSAYVDQAATLFCECVKFIASSLRGIIPEGLFDSMINLLDALLKIDNLKDTKSSIILDFTRYKRVVAQYTKGQQASIETINELAQIQDFLKSQDVRKNRNYVLKTVREKTRVVVGNEEVLLDMLTYTCDRIEKRRYLHPDEMFCLIRALPHLIILIDGEKDERGDDKIMASMAGNNMMPSSSSGATTANNNTNNNTSSSSSTNNANNIFRIHKSRLTPVQRLFKRYPVVPVLYDVPMTLVYVLDRAVHYDSNTMAEAWATPGTISSSTSSSMVSGGPVSGASGAMSSGSNVGQSSVVTPPDAGYDLCAVWSGIRNTYSAYASRLSSLDSSLVVTPFPGVVSGAASVETQLRACEVFECVWEGFRLLGAWTAQLHLSVVWKLSHPVGFVSSGEDTTASAASGSESQSEYARAFKANLSRNELTALADMVFLIKSLSSRLRDMEDRVSSALRTHMYCTLQQFVKGDLVPLLHRLEKRKKGPLRDMLNVRSLVADWDQSPVDDDYRNYSSRMGPVDVRASVRTRPVPLSTQRLGLLRVVLRGLFDEKSELRKKEGLLWKSEVHSVDMEAFDRIYQESRAYGPLLNFASTLRSLGDLSPLWYREFFLDMTKSVQFPLSLSLPWMLCEHILRGPGGASTTTTSGGTVGGFAMEGLFSILDVYNDCASMSLYGLRQPHLYDEVEAESTLVLDQLLYLITEEVYTHHRQGVSSGYLDPVYRDQIEAIRHSHGVGGGRPQGWKVPGGAGARFEGLLKQRVVRILDREVDLGQLVSRNINNKFFRDVDVAIRRFESGDLSGILEFRTMLDILRSSHRSLTSSSSLGLRLDPFDAIVHDVNQTFVQGSFRGRLSFHVVATLVLDLLPNTSFNFYTQRFVRSPVPMKTSEYRGKSPRQSALNQLYGGGSGVLTKAFEQHHRLSRGFVGDVHWEALLDLSPFIDLAVVLDQCQQNLSIAVKDLAGFSDALQGGIPPLTMPKYHFLSVGSYGYFEGKLRPVLEYEDLKPEVFQGLRVIGNTVAVFQGLTRVMDTRTGLDSMMSAAFVGRGPMPSSATSAASVATCDTCHNQLICDSLKSEHLKLISGISEAASGDIDDMCQKCLSRMRTVVTEDRSLVKGLMSTLRTTMESLNLFQLWSAKVITPSNEAPKTPDAKSLLPVKTKCMELDIEHTQAFHKLWSALCFLYSLPVRSKANPNSDPNSALGDDNNVEDVSDEEQFGHGFLLAGCTFIHMMGQQALFELTDFSRYVIQVYEHEKTVKSYNESQDAKGIADLVGESQGFISNALEYNKIQQEIFAMLAATTLCSNNNTNNSNSNSNKINVKKINVIRPVE